MSKVKSFFVKGFLVAIILVMMGGQAYAGGTKQVRVVPLGTSGAGGTSYIGQDIASGPYFASCGSVKYNLQHNVNYGAYKSTSFKFNSTGYTVRSLSGSLKGGVGFIGNYETTAYNKYNYNYNGVRLYKGSTAKYTWNYTMPLGSKNRNAHYDVTTTSGFSNPPILCNNELNIVMDVGGRSSLALKQNEVPASFKENSEKISDALGDGYKVDEKAFTSNAMLSNFHDENENIALTQQTDNAIEVVGVEDYELITSNEMVYEVGEFYNAADVKVNVVRFEKNNVFMSLVSEQDVESILEFAESL
ncbi:hypothetical protein A1A1_01448 [Planococcus antarcticus DSM 14505]|uniref:Uncharacterized protein n=1 Tax=Planococcus antarcticus DSM 14505 TaxID=1185653 RepID=A0A1C7DHV4_9BACL|nr:hypothetical protein [Planococcus antarcticus]ANU10851.1 hypothetical protein BBH88_11280 [Planococcus antarcticus DSM 14505]EIM08318.1 hypothetical protein A1A1_01448 [Planococcus antarcticus DSM 14505]